MGPSPRLARAVAAERATLERQRARLANEAGELRAALARIEQGMAEIDAQCGLLDRLVANEARATAAGAVSAGGAGADDGAWPRAEAADHALRGPAIRVAAVEALLKHGLEGLHYRDWYDLLTHDGKAVAGKDPQAVFLTQLSRSPVIRKGARPGHYELDRQAPARLRSRLEALHREYVTAIRRRKTEIAHEIAKTGKRLDEATHLLEDLRDAA